jgi:hypothetical protein
MGPRRDLHRHDAATPRRDRPAGVLRLPLQTTSLERPGQPLASSTRSSRGRTPSGRASARAADSTTSTRPATPSATASSDSLSIVVGHEYSEAVTDPDNFASIQDGWNDAQGSENADKCAWIETQNITLAGHQFAVQPTWSNEAYDAGKDGCAVSR